MERVIRLTLAVAATPLLLTVWLLNWLRVPENQEQLVGEILEGRE